MTFLSYRYGRLLACLCAAALGIPSAARAQDARVPLQQLPLNGLSSFQPVGDNWQIVGGVSAALDQEAPLRTTLGTGVLVNTGASGQGDDLFTTWEHGDVELELDYMMPQGSNSGIYFQGRYEVQLFDSWGTAHPTFTDAGGIYERWDESRGDGNEGYQGISPLQNPQRAPGLWNHLRIVFQAPRFDAEGDKIENATFKIVEHNGVVVQENVEVTGPTRAAAFEDEQAMGPLMIQGDHGPVAFRNVRYKRYGQDRITLSDVRYEVYEGVFERPADYAGMVPVQQGRSDGFDSRSGGLDDRFALTFQGDMEVPVTGTYLFGLDLGWIDDDPHFTGANRGGGKLVIDGQDVLLHPGKRRTATATAPLEAGAYPFTLTYFKNRAWADPVVAFYVEGSGIPYHTLNAPGTLPDPPSYARITVEPEGEPLLQRSFLWHDGEKRVNVMNVGDPSGAHYAYDLNTGALLYVWKGSFIDTTPMWHSRGNDQVAIPLGSTVSFSGAPSLAVLPNPDAPWPDSLDADAYAYEAYRLDAHRRPTFSYTVYGVEVDDALVPEQRAGGTVLVRSLEMSDGSPDGLWLRVAAGDTITRREDGLYSVDGAYYVDLTQTGGQQPVVRTQGGRRELIIPVRFNQDEARLSYAIIW